MKIEIPLIFWHGNRDRIMSIDFYPNSNFLVTCGAEAEDKMWIKLWEIDETDTSEISNDANPFKTSAKNPLMDKDSSMTMEDVSQSGSKIKPKFLYDISGAHTATVNIVRFSPNGMYLASGGDDSAIVLWVQKSRPVEFGSTIEKVVWCNYKVLRGHLSDIYDIAWSPDSRHLISGSVDNTATIFNIEKGKGIQKIADHSHFVQGVSWDPRNKYVTTQSSDKSVRVYKNADMKQETKFFFANAIKRYIGKGEENEKNIEKNADKKNANFFADELQCPSFVRRHCWSPEGSVLLLVAGLASGQSDFVVWGFTRKDLTKPAFMLPTLDKAATVVRFCPILFEKEPKEGGNPELIDLPYKMVFAVGTLDSLYIYNTQDIIPKYAVTNIHYQPITDLAWKGSSVLAASSSDGYITFCTFEKEELGRPADLNSIPEKARFGYETYLNCDHRKSILNTQNVTMKVVKKKTEEGGSKLPTLSEGSSSMMIDSDMHCDNLLVNQVESAKKTEDEPIKMQDKQFEHDSVINIPQINNIQMESTNVKNGIGNNPQPPKRRINPTFLK